MSRTSQLRACHCSIHFPTHDGEGSVEEVAEAAWLLLDQARIVGGEPLPDPAAFSKRLSEVMRRALAA